MFIRKLNIDDINMRVMLENIVNQIIGVNIILKQTRFSKFVPTSEFVCSSNKAYEVNHVI